METPSIPLIKESVPFAKTKMSHSSTDRKRGFAQNPCHPHLTPRGEVGALINNTHYYAKVYVDSKENQPAAKSLYQQI